MRVERAQVEEINVTYCEEDIRAMLRFEDSDGKTKPLPEDASIFIDDGKLRVRFFQERTVTNDIPGVVVGEPVAEDSRFKYTQDDVRRMLGYDSTVDVRAAEIYGMMVEADEPMTSKDVRAALHSQIGLGAIRKSIIALEKIAAIEYCGSRWPQARDGRQLRKMNSFRPTRRKEEQVTSEE